MEEYQNLSNESRLKRLAGKINQFVARMGEVPAAPLPEFSDDHGGTTERRSVNYPLGNLVLESI